MEAFLLNPKVVEYGVWLLLGVTISYYVRGFLKKGSRGHTITGWFMALCLIFLFLLHTSGSPILIQDITAQEGTYTLLPEELPGLYDFATGIKTSIFDWSFPPGIPFYIPMVALLIKFIYLSFLAAVLLLSGISRLLNNHYPKHVDKFNTKLKPLSAFVSKMVERSD